MRFTGEGRIYLHFFLFILAFSEWATDIYWDGFSWRTRASYLELLVGFIGHSLLGFLLISIILSLFFIFIFLLISLIFLAYISKIFFLSPPLAHARICFTFLSLVGIFIHGLWRRGV
ncbi:hypothetical protein DFH27DRAFT_172296 [Peziza echinospora]|nr:hypothetical protein DFH27DRAFT_172296 [Peziza echinospora]